MTFDAVLEQVQILLQREKRVSYRGLKRRFDLDDAYLEDLKEELIGAKRLAADEDGRFLVWREALEPAAAPSSQPAPAPSATHVEPRLPPAERRQLTVEFIDLVGSTTLSEQLDPEELRELIRAYQQTSVEVIERYGGYTAQYLGDGLLVYFGYPAAHEDDAARAVRAGLGTVAALQELNTRLSHPLQVRIGIHTGPVVVGEMGGGGKREQLALGETPNIAARVQGQAAPDTVTISAATYRLVQGLFECQDLGRHELHGVSTPLPLYRVAHESEVQSRFEVAVRTGLTPLVGREEDVALLRRDWERTKEGDGQVVFVSGEPGIGKSRLIQVLKEQGIKEGAIRIEFRCLPHHQNSGLYPVIQHLQRMLQFARTDPPQTKLKKLRRTLDSYQFPQTDTVGLVAALLSLPHPDGEPHLNLTPHKQKQKTQETLIAWLLEETHRSATLLVGEDLQWADPSSLELLTLLIERASTARMLVILTYRPEFSPPWPWQVHMHSLVLDRLPQQQVEAMVQSVAEGKVFPPAMMQQLVIKTDGIPLFVEEMTKNVLESGLLLATGGHYELTGPLPQFAIPATLQDSLMARLDRLNKAREVAQLGATFGREFSYDLLHAISPLDEPTLQQGLIQLVEAELVYQRGQPPHARYLFKHALIQEAAYQSLLKSTRQQLHRHIAQVLEARLSETLETHPALVGHHYTEARLFEQAIPYWRRAGERAAQRSAYVEAISHLSTALELLQTRPDTPERAQHELTLLIALGVPLMATKGWGEPEVERTYARARELCRRVGATPQLFSVLLALSAFYLMRAEYTTVHELGEQCLNLARNTHSPTRFLWAHSMLGHALVCLGKLSPAREHLQQGSALYTPQKHNPLVSGTVQDPGVQCLCFVALALWLLGYPDQALKRSQEAVARAHEFPHPFSQAYALYCSAWIHQFRREVEALQERIEEVIPLSREHGFPIWVAWGTVQEGWGLVEQGQTEEGVARLRQGIAAHRATGAVCFQPYYLALLAEAYGKAGQTGEGITTLAEALGVTEKNGERWWAAELHRLKGELLLSGERGMRNTEREAEACFQQAIDIARQQQAQSLELRAVMSLSRLWQQQEKKAEAHQLLSAVYNWFTEGFDTKDLQEAKALLEESR